MKIKTTINLNLNLSCPYYKEKTVRFLWFEKKIKEHCNEELKILENNSNKNFVVAKCPKHNKIKFQF